jgi:dihydrofolate reductase
MDFTLVAAMDERRGIGYRGKIPWHVPRDLQHFKEITFGKDLIIGRTSFDGIGPLRDRRWHVLTSKPIAPHDRVFAYSDVSDLPEGSYVVAGGESVYKAFLPLPNTRRIILSLIPGVHPADTFFPEFERDWVLDSLEDRIGFKVAVYTR